MLNKFFTLLHHWKKKLDPVCPDLQGKITYLIKVFHGKFNKLVYTNARFLDQKLDFYPQACILVSFYTGRSYTKKLSKGKP